MVGLKISKVSKYKVCPSRSYIAMFSLFRKNNEENAIHIFFFPTKSLCHQKISKMEERFELYNWTIRCQLESTPIIWCPNLEVHSPIHKVFYLKKGLLVE